MLGYDLFDFFIIYFCKLRENISVDNNNQVRGPIHSLNERELSDKIRALVNFYEPLIKGGFSINTFGFGEKNDDFILNEFARIGIFYFFFLNI
jgi:hypothetical protein